MKSQAQHVSKSDSFTTRNESALPSLRFTSPVLQLEHERFVDASVAAEYFCRVHLRPAAKKAGVVIPDGHRWGLHNLRHSLSNWLVNKAKENPKTVQGILGHSRIQTTLDLYTDEDLDEMIAAQEKFLDAVGFESGSVQ